MIISHPNDRQKVGWKKHGEKHVPNRLCLASSQGIVVKCKAAIFFMPWKKVQGCSSAVSVL